MKPASRSASAWLPLDSREYVLVLSTVKRRSGELIEVV
jgi:hypothetical protein